MESIELEKLRDIISQVLNIENMDEITVEKTFVDDLGADSLEIFQIVMGVEEEFGIEIANDEIDTIATVSDALEKIKTALN